MRVSDTDTTLGSLCLLSRLEPFEMVSVLTLIDPCDGLGDISVHGHPSIPNRMTYTWGFSGNDDLDVDYDVDYDDDIVMEGADFPPCTDEILLTNDSRFEGIGGSEVAIHRYRHDSEYLYSRVTIETGGMSETIALPVTVHLIGNDSHWPEVCRVGVVYMTCNTVHFAVRLLFFSI